ncbi:MAG: hypothetical protein BGO24_13350 [Sphingomonas sp. 67-36]|nr:MAG: hypothetical protein BGO24_13350 [Sphingomonas sp. 67-36]
MLQRAASAFCRDSRSLADFLSMAIFRIWPARHRIIEKADDKKAYRPPMEGRIAGNAPVSARP